MSEPEAVKMVFACGPGMCDMDAGSIATEEGVKIFTGGAEGMLKVFDPQDLETAVKEMNLDELDEGDDGLCVTAVAVSPGGEEVALGLRNGDVKLYDLPSLEFRSNLTRFTAPVLGLHYGMKDGGVIAACSEEPGIRIIRRGNNNHTLKLDDHDGGVKSVKWDPKGEFLAAAGFDGTVKVWSVDPALEEMATEVVSSANYFSKEAVGLGESGSEGFSHLGKIAWHPEGKSLSVTGGTDPLMLARGDWKRSMIVPEDAAQGGHTSEITVSSFSPDGRYLATAALDGRVVLWDTEEKEAVKTFVNTANENWRDLQWLDGSTVAALSTGGSLCTLQNVPPPTAKATNSSAVDSAVGGDKTSKKGTSKKGKEGVPQEEDGGGGGERAKRVFDLEAVEDNGGEVSETDTSPIDDDDDDVAAAAVDVGEGDVTVNLDGAGGLAEGDGSGGGGDGTGDGAEDILGMIPTTPAVGAPQFQVETTPMQDPFQPSSTPLGDARRYLCWNRVGTILSVDENTHNDVEIEFADKSAGRNQRFMDTWNFVMGSLSSTGAVFASVAQGEEDEEGGSAGPSPSGGRSVLYYKTLGRRSTGEEWTRMMPKGENVLGVAVGRGWAAAATDRQLLRLFTASGLQGETIMLPGPIVTMAGGGDVLAVVFHQGEPQGDSQKLGYQVLDVGGKRELSKGDLCLSPGSELTWLGTSEEGMVVSMDSAGLVSGLTLSFGWQWSPLLDTLKVSKNKKDRFWPVGLVTGKLLAATLKSGEEHPTAYPRPVLTSVPLSALCAKSRDGEEMASFEKTFPQLEARARQRRFNLDNGLTEDDGGGGADAAEMEGVLMSQHAQLDTMVVKRIQQACADENPERAMDLASLLNLEKSFTIAIKVANHHGLTSLAANMDDAMIAKFRSEEEEHDEDDASDNEELMGGGRHSSEGNRGGGGNDNLGPLDRARLLQSKRPGAKSNNNDNDENGGGLTLDNALAVDSDVEELDSSGEGGGGDGKKSLKRRSVGREGGAEGDSEEEGEGGGEGSGVEEEEEKEAEEAELAAPAATVPRNPFARGATFSSPPRKKRKDVMETMHDLRSSPSPTAASKRTPLSRLSSFSTEARTKKRNDRNIL